MRFPLISNYGVKSYERNIFPTYVTLRYKYHIL